MFPSQTLKVLFCLEDLVHMSGQAKEEPVMSSSLSVLRYLAWLFSSSAVSKSEK